MDVIPFTPDLDRPAAEMVARRVATGRAAASPLIPGAWTDARAYVQELEAMHRRGSGIALVHASRLVGFMSAFEVRRGRTWTYTPEWAWAAEGVRPAGISRRSIIEDLYAGAARRWVDAGFRTHYVSVMSDDRLALRALAWLGFGVATADGLRDLSGLEGPANGVVVRRAARADAVVLTELEDGLRAHLADSPVFFELGPARTLAEQRKRIADDAAAVLMAEVNGRVVGHMLVGPASDDAATVIRDRGTASISGAFVRVEHRRVGVAMALLAGAIEWARDRGYERIAVDFETANLLASRFWLRAFRPVTFTLVRRL